MQAKSPRLDKLLSEVLVNQRAGREWYKRAKPDPSIPIAKAYMITSILLHAYAAQQSNFLPQTVGIYLHNSGVQRRVIETLSEFGVCTSYRTTMNQLEQKADIV
ncbi:hypothetical protein F4781DRAFT_382062 [Annulohypoxylon bovei var. microspora]|nr:hypothetical protein F4781DRAFT_382062 [Annulohypoxylon bovei var. microspora]